MTYLRSDALSSARAYIFKQAEENGIHCPCCDQFVKVYQRQIHSTMARSLIFMWKRAKMEGCHLPTVLGKWNTGDVAKLQYWGLIEPILEPLRDDGSRRNGWWKITPLGRQWLFDEASVQKYAFVYNQQLLRLDGPFVSIKDCLTKRFNYAELMRMG